MQDLERRNKFMSREVVTLKDSLWRLTKRVTALESFIVKKFGNSKNVLDIDEHDLEDLLDYACTRKGPIRGMENTHDDSDEDDETYKPYQTSATKRKAKTPNRIQPSATRYGRIPKIPQNPGVSVMDDDEEEGFDSLPESDNSEENDQDQDYQEPEDKKLFVIDSCEVSMMESGNEADNLPNAMNMSGNQEIEPIQRYTCPECSGEFAGKAFLNFHLKKVHPNLRVIIQSPQKVKPEVKPKKVITQSSQTKEETADRILPPEVASQIIKYSVRVGSNCKQLTLNGYNFSRCKTNGHLVYWRCKQAKHCSGTLIENEAKGTFRRGAMGWGMDGLTHLTHPPNFAKIEIALKKGRAIDLGLDWDGKRKCLRKHPPKRRVMKGLHILESSKNANQTATSAKEDQGSTYSLTASTAITGTNTSDSSEHSRPPPRDQGTGISSAAAGSSYGLPYMVPGYSLSLPLPTPPISSHNSGFGQYTGHNP